MTKITKKIMLAMTVFTNGYSSLYDTLLSTKNATYEVKSLHFLQYISSGAFSYFVISLIGIMLSFVMLSDVMLNVIALSVVN